MRPQRETSTPEQLDAVILDGDADPCRYVYAVEVWGEGLRDHRWRQQVPPHAVIHALRRDRDVYAELLTLERASRIAAERAYSELRDALLKCVPSLLFEGLAES